MSERFKDIYRIPSARLRNWDYGWNAPYFVTISTAHRECYFGEIINGKMILSEIGKIAEQYWNEIPHHFTFVEMGEFVVMPNHVHGIIIFNKSDDGCHDAIGNANGRDAINRVSTEPRTTTGKGMETKTIGGITGIYNPMLHDNLSRIIRWYKGRVAFESHKIHASFDWQFRFHEHIIRTDESFQHISKYIRNNPSNWHDDKFYDRMES